MNNSPVIVEDMRGTDAGLINRSLHHMAWLMAHKDVFRSPVVDRLGGPAASQVLWSGPRLVSVAGEFTGYDVHAVREHRRSIDLVRCRFFGNDHIGLEHVASATGHAAAAKGLRLCAAGRPAVRGQGGALAEATDQVLLGLGGEVTRVQRRQYAAYHGLRNFAVSESAALRRLPSR
ncbi:hypothetical protein [Streptomyces sp. NPDC001450]